VGEGGCGNFKEGKGLCLRSGDQCEIKLPSDESPGRM
jgi:hypothetical protein